MFLARFRFLTLAWFQQDGMRSKHVVVWAVVIGLAIRLWRLDAALWYDEAVSAWLAMLPPERLLSATLGDVHPPGYYALLWAIGRLFGYAELVLRLPSVIAGVGLIYLVARLGFAFQMPRKAVGLAVAITALTPFQIYYAQEVRSYALLMVAVTVAALGLVERRWWLFVIGSLAAFYLHNIAVVFVISLCMVAWFNLSAHEMKPFFIAVAVILSGFLPGVIFLWLQAQAVGYEYWIPLTLAGRVLTVFDDLLFFSPGSPFTIASGLVTSLTLIVLLADLGKMKEEPALSLLAMVVIPFGLVVLGSVFWQPILISRVMAPVTPFLYLLIGWVMTRSRRRLIAWSMLAFPTMALILSLSMFGVIGRQARDKAQFDLYGDYRPGDALYHANVVSYVRWHYYRPDILQYLWPQEDGLAQGLSSQTKNAMGMQQVDFEKIVCQPDGPRRWWLIYARNPLSGDDEINYVNALLERYPSYQFDTGLYRLEPECGR
jgi:uncharacterized membrane protein